MPQQSGIVSDTNFDGNGMNFGAFRQQNSGRSRLFLSDQHVQRFEWEEFIYLFFKYEPISFFLKNGLWTSKA